MSNNKTIKRAKVLIRLEVNYEYDYTKDLPLDQLEQTAIHLAVNPNYHTIESGVQLTGIVIDHLDNLGRLKR